MLAVFFASPQVATATTKNWNTLDGNWNTDGNWTPSGTPSTSDLAVFNRGRFGYTVSFPGSLFAPRLYQAAFLDVRNDDVTFRPSGVGEASFKSLGSMLIGNATNSVGSLTTFLPVTAPAAFIAEPAGSIVGAHVDASSWTLTLNNDVLNVGTSGFATLSISGGAQVELTGSIANVTLGKNNGATGRMFVSGAGAQLLIDNDGILNVGSTEGGIGQLNITGGGRVAGAAGSGASSISADSTASIDGAGSTWSMTGRLEVYGTLSVSNSGRVTMGDKVALIDGTVNGDGQIFGNLYSFAEGTVSPGAPFGTLQVIGQFKQVAASTGYVEIHLGGASPTQYSALSATGGIMLLGQGELDVSLMNGFMPQAGNSFHILDFPQGGISGTFTTISVPALPAGLMWNASQLYTAGTLSVQIDGDYNGDGVVNAADYVIYRKTLGMTGGFLAADGNHNFRIDTGDYTVWRALFGQTAGGGSALPSAESLSAAVPEPESAGLLLCGCIGLTVMGLCRRRRNKESGNKGSELFMKNRSDPISSAEASAAQYTTLILALGVHLMRKHPPVILFPRVAVLFSAIGLLAAAPSSLIAGTPFTPFPISTIPDHGEVAPRIDGRYVVWTELEYRGGSTPTDSNDVLGYDLQTHQAFPIATGSAEQDDPAISGDLAAWYDGGHVFAKHLSPGGGAAFNVTPFGSEQYDPAVSGNLIVWTDSRFAHQTIWGRYADQPASSAFQISSTAAYEQFTSDVSGSIVVWASFGETGDGRNIYGRDLSGAINGGAIFSICSDPGVQDNPHVSGNIAVWEDWRSGTAQIYGKNLITSVEFPVSEGGAGRYQVEPQIDGNIVVWKTGTWHVWARDLSSGGPAFPVTTETTDYAEQYIDVSGNTVVWSQIGSGIFEGDIYGTVIPEPSAAGMSIAAAACLAAYVASLRNRLPHR